MSWKRIRPRGFVLMQTLAAALAAGAFALVPAAGTAAQARPLSVEQAVRMALEASPEVRGAAWDLQSSQAQALAARLRMIPSLSLTAAYEHLSDTPATTLTIPPFPPYLGEPVSVDLPANFKNQTDTGSLTLRLQYPVFAGFRLLEAARIADLKSLSRGCAAEVIKRALVFEVQRAYWEAMRAEAAVSMLADSRDAAQAVRQDVQAQAAQGLATRTEVMNADQQLDQAEISLSDAQGQRDRAWLALASLLGQNEEGRRIFEAGLARASSPEASSPAEAPFALVSDPALLPAWAAGQPADPGSIIPQALARRAEIRLSTLSVQIAERAVKAAQAGLYPTLSLVGDYTYANPNPRILVSALDLVPGFYGSWDAGVMMSYDLGAVPAAAAQARAAEADARKAREEARGQAEEIVLEVRSTALSLGRARRDLELSESAVQQAEANRKIQQDRQGKGLARRLDVTSAELALSRARFSLTSRRIDLQIAAADFARAAGLELTPATR